jgi:hypothetical protein
MHGNGRGGVARSNPLPPRARHATAEALRAASDDAAAAARLKGLEARETGLTDDEARELHVLRWNSPRYQRRQMYLMFVTIVLTAVMAALWFDFAYRDERAFRQWYPLPYSAVVAHRVHATVCYADPCWAAVAIVAFAVPPSAPVPAGPVVEAAPAAVTTNNRSVVLSAPFAAARLFLTCWWPVLTSPRHEPAAPTTDNVTDLCASPQQPLIWPYDGDTAATANESAAVLHAAVQQLPLGSSVDAMYNAGAPGWPLLAPADVAQFPAGVLNEELMGSAWLLMLAVYLYTIRRAAARVRQLSEEVHRDQARAADALVAFAMAHHARLGSASAARSAFFGDATLYEPHLLGEIFEFVDGRAWTAAVAHSPMLVSAPTALSARPSCLDIVCVGAWTCACGCCPVAPGPRSQCCTTWWRPPPSLVPDMLPPHGSVPSPRPALSPAELPHVGAATAITVLGDVVAVDVKGDVDVAPAHARPAAPSAPLPSDLTHACLPGAVAVAVASAPGTPTFSVLWPEVCRPDRVA